MASSPLRYVSPDELMFLANRLRNLGCSTLGGLLGLDQYIIENAAKEDDDQLYKLLTTWQDEQVIGSDIRGCLAQLLQRDFPNESEFILHPGKEKGKNVICK